MLFAMVVDFVEKFSLLDLHVATSYHVGEG